MCGLSFAAHFVDKCEVMAVSATSLTGIVRETVKSAFLRKPSFKGFEDIMW